jgi:hypothetical protein
MMRVMDLNNKFQSGTDRVFFVRCFGGVYLSASVDVILREVDGSLKAFRLKNLQYRIRTVNVSVTETNVAVCTDTAQILILDAVTTGNCVLRLTTWTCLRHALWVSVIPFRYNWPCVLQCGSYMYFL